MKKPLADRYIRCRYCTFQVRPMARYHGRVVSGWKRLWLHMENEHESEMLCKEARLNAYMAEKLSRE